MGNTKYFLTTEVEEFKEEYECSFLMKSQNNLFETKLSTDN
jgi:hypothetical protein